MPSFTKFPAAATVQIFDLTVCNITPYPTWWSNAFTMIQFILATVSLALVIIQSAKEALQMYQVTRKWQLNRYMEILLRDCVLYFFVYVSSSLFLSTGLISQRCDQHLP